MENKKEKKVKNFREWKLDDEVIKQVASRHRAIQHEMLKDYKFECRRIKN